MERRILGQKLEVGLEKMKDKKEGIMNKKIEQAVE